MTNEQLNESRQQIAAFIQNKRKELGISQAELAQQTGMGIATIKRFESGKFWLNMKQYIMLRNALQLPTSF
ncbi:multiprotein-bridging factor 1 family protein [Parasediminibacterium paludis]|uniref:Multiprotein-bridging factor 1 family protein n=1 Tax=Parasediminibacterium paludis TaxID=908966 RepID=A0ABV8PU65_9BACT